MKFETIQIGWQNPPPKRMHEIIGNEAAKRAVEIALSGSHEIVFLSSIRSPASDMLRAAAQIAKENNLPFKGSVVPVCTCGAYGNPLEECRCTVDELKKYASKVISMFRRAQIIVEVVEPNARDQVVGIKGYEPESAMIARIKATHDNAVPAGWLSRDCEELLKMAVSQLHADSTNAIAVASTIARMSDSGIIQAMHIAEAAQYQHRHLADWTDDFEDIAVNSPPVSKLKRLKVKGMRFHGKVIINVNNEDLPSERSIKLRNHSPDGFDFGYCGSGPAQLALALMLEGGVEESVALAHYQTFKEKVIAQVVDPFELDLEFLPYGSWIIHY